MGGSVCAGDRIIAGGVRDCAVAVRDSFAVLYVETTNLGQCAGGGIVGGKKLSNSCEFGLGVNCRAGTIERSVALTV